VASFDRSIPPGGEGNITLSLRTKNYEGLLIKTAQVYTNAPSMRVITLTLKATIATPISVLPPYASFYGMAGKVFSLPVEVKAGLDKPLTLSPGKSNLGDKITYTIEELKKGRRFRILFTNVPGPAGTFEGYLNLQTNYVEKPLINIRVISRFVESSGTKLCK
jgi:hypothetical protein